MNSFMTEAPIIEKIVHRSAGLLLTGNMDNSKNS